MIKQIVVCDSCGQILDKACERYHIDFQSSKFIDAAGSRDYNSIRVDLCSRCARDAVGALKRIASQNNSST